MSAATPRTWREVLEWQAGEQLTVERIDARYRRLASIRHPDKPIGSVEAMAELDRARAEAIAAIDGSASA